MSSRSHRDLARRCREALTASAGEAWPPEADELLRLAAADGEETAAAASEALFRDVVEALADPFDPRLSDVYARFFSRLIEQCRGRPGFSALDRRLRRFGIASPGDLPARFERIRRPRVFSGDPRKVKKIVTPSRVTFGADTAVTSVFFDALKRAFPAAEIVFPATEKAAEFFAADRRVSPLAIRYPRGGSLAARLRSWAALADAVEEAAARLAPGELLVVDPDSRLTQLGLLPLAGEEETFLFESRRYRPDSDQPLGALAAEWLEETFGPAAGGARPYLALPTAIAARGRALRDTADRPLAAVNLGVGADPAKRVGEEFESGLIETLLEAGYAIVLDRGAGEEERRRIESLAQGARSRGRRTAEVGAADSRGAELLLFEGSLAAFSGFIAAADLYIGYDSAGGHIAAALGVRSIDVFRGAANERMRRRWSPWGARPAEVIAAEEPLSPGDVLEKVRERLF